MKMKMNIRELLFTWPLKKTTEAVACSDSPPLPAAAADADADEISAAKDYRNSLKEQKKLCLVINLDDVLINSIDLCHSTKYDEFYFSNSGVQMSYNEGKLHTVFHPPKIRIKLRPYIRSFLQDMSLSYDILLFSKRSPAYVDRIHKLLDPNATLNLTLISLLGDSNSAPHHHHHHPQLKLFLSNPDLLVILDDTEKGWDNKYCSNLIKVAPYPYFTRPKMKTKSWTKMMGDECEKGGELYRICHRLECLRNFIYDPNLDVQDTRQVIQKFRSNNCLDNFHLCYV